MRLIERIIIRNHPELKGGTLVYESYNPVTHDHTILFSGPPLPKEVSPDFVFEKDA